jgi:cytochrome c-type biogenesis protein CcmH/NrfG
MDPGTLFAAATVAYKGVKTAIRVGRDIEDTWSQLKTWATHITDLKEKVSQAEEAQALDVALYKRKIYEQEKELRELLIYKAPSGVWEDFCKERRRIKEMREQEIYRRERMKQNLIRVAKDTALVGGLVLFTSYIIYLLVSMINNA